MKLIIDTTKNNDIIVALKSGGSIVLKKKVSAQFSQAEKLLPLIDKMLAQTGTKLNKLKDIEVCNESGGLDSGYKTSFTALRIGVITANALGYALGIPVKGTAGATINIKKIRIANPIYNQEPNITLKKKT